MPTDPLTASRYPSNTDAPNVPQHLQNAVFDLSDNTIPYFASTTARNTAYSNWTAQGGVMREGLYCHVSGLGMMVYSGGAWRTIRSGLLSESLLSDSGTHTGGTTFSTKHSITVTIPAGLHTGQRIRVHGTVFISTGSTVGARVKIAGADERSSGGSGSISGDMSAFRYDSSLTAGSRTYNLQVASTTSGDVVWRYPYLSVEIVG